MNIETKILKILKKAADLSKSSMQIQTIDLLLLKSGETDFLGIFLIEKISEMINAELIEKVKSKYSITQKGIIYLENSVK
jgi:hypothetical protein